MAPMAAARKKTKGPVANIVELVVTVAVAIGLALLIQAFLVKPYKIPSGSMIPTLEDRAADPRQPARHAPGRRGHRRLPPAGRRRPEPGRLRQPRTGARQKQPCDKSTPAES